MSIVISRESGETILLPDRATSSEQDGVKLLIDQMKGVVAIEIDAEAHWRALVLDGDEFKWVDVAEGVIPYSSEKTYKSKAVKPVTPLKPA